MPLQHHAENTTLQPVYQSETTQTAPPHDASAIVINTIAERRYDASTVQQIIALAEQMQTRHRETLSRNDVENLGNEVGVEPEFIRRAMAQMQDETDITAALPSARRKGVRRGRALLTARRLTRRQRAMAFIPAAVYLIFVVIAGGFKTFTFQNVEIASGRFDGPFFYYVFLPAFLALCAGGMGKSKRVGAVGGGLLGTIVTFAMLGDTMSRHGQMPSLSDYLPVLAVLAGSGGLLGIISAGVRQTLSRPYWKQLRLRLAVETEEAAPQPTSDWI